MRCDEKHVRFADALFAHVCLQSLVESESVAGKTNRHFLGLESSAKRTVNLWYRAQILALARALGTFNRN